MKLRQIISFKPKYLKPFYLLLFTSVVTVICYSILFVILSYILGHSINFLFLIISSVLLFFIIYFLFGYILKIFIYDRIKLIYKSILNKKIPLSEKNREIDLKSDVLGNVSRNVQLWAESYEKEIDGLKKMESFRREFIGNVSHELKTPIFNIQGYVLTLLDGAVEDKKVKYEYLEKAEKNIERLINIVQDLEVISQLETGELKLEFSRFDLISLVKEVFEMLERKAQEKNINLVFQAGINADRQIFVNADKERIRQVLTNLIDNSIKYGKEGGRTKISFYDMDENLLIEVSDDGIGIEAKYLSRLFERFFRVDKSRSRSLGGSGLGLAIVKHIIETHRQTINVRSSPGVGSTFSFTLKKG